MNFEEYYIEKIIKEIEELSEKFNMSKEKIIKIYLLNEIKQLNAQLEEYLIYRES